MKTENEIIQRIYAAKEELALLDRINLGQTEMLSSEGYHLNDMQSSLKSEIKTLKWVLND